ncbi:MAG TPA: M28 family peptidase [Terriglobales bacterium]|jgi:glutaminyl-peptide cyclotransferase|nr:M28 family peptidase [Terriglobales bacterium]
MRLNNFALALGLGVAMLCSACAQSSSAPKDGTASPQTSTSTPQDAAPQTVAQNVAPEKPIAQMQAPPSTVAHVAAPRINAARAMQYTREIVNMGPRPIGSPAHARLEAYLRLQLKKTAANVQEDVFTAQTPAGAFPIRNFIAEYPGSRDGVVVIASHYDTVLPLKNFVGANDGGSSTGLLLELGNELHSKGKLPGYSVWLVCLDGEEAVKEWTDTDSVYGSRHLAEKWQADGTNKKIKAFLLADMIGDKDLDIDRDESSTPWLEDLVFQASTNLGLQSYFFARTIGIDDDHIPFAKNGVPVADLIDFSYGYNNVFWHTPQDTLDKLSPRSLEITGNVLLETKRLLDEK